MEELKEEKMYCLVAPDGSTQLSTLAPDYPMCLAMIRMLHQAGIGQNSEKLLNAGFKILPVKVTITQDGDENEAFNRAKDELEETGPISHGLAMEEHPGLK